MNRVLGKRLSAELRSTSTGSGVSVSLTEGVVGTPVGGGLGVGACVGGAAVGGDAEGGWGVGAGVGGPAACMVPVVAVEKVDATTVPSGAVWGAARMPPDPFARSADTAVTMKFDAEAVLTSTKVSISKYALVSTFANT